MRDEPDQIQTGLAVAGASDRERWKDLDNQARRDILLAVRQNPGLNQTDLIETTELGRGSVEYHLAMLEDRGYLYSLSCGRERHYFLIGFPSTVARGISAIRKGRALAVVEAVLDEPGRIQKEIANCAGMSRKILRGYLDHLRKAGLISEEVVGRTREYYPTEDLKDLITYVLQLSSGAPDSGTGEGDGRQPVR